MKIAFVVPLFLIAVTAIAQDSQSAVGQPVQVPPATVQIDCSKERIPAPVPITTAQTKAGAVGLADATAFVKNAIDAAQCEIHQSAPRFLLTNVDIDLQTVTDADGTIEVLFIGGLAGERDVTTTADTDFTYSVPTPGNYPLEAEKIHNPVLDAIKAWLFPSKVPKPQNLAALITKSVKQLNDNVTKFPALSQHQVKLSLKFALLQDVTVEAEPKLGSVGVTAKWKYSSTATQTLTLTFADQTPIISLDVSPSASAGAGHFDFTATAIPPSGFPGPVQGTITFRDGTTSLQTVSLQNGVAALPAFQLGKGVHTLFAVYSGPLLDTTASSTTVKTVF